MGRGLWAFSGTSENNSNPDSCVGPDYLFSLFSGKGWMGGGGGGDQAQLCKEILIKMNIGNKVQGESFSPD